MPEQAEPILTPDQAPPTASKPHRARHYWLLAAVAVAAFATDQISKVIALDALADGAPRPFIGDFIRLRLIFNPGAALSLGAGNTWIMTVIALGVLAAIIFVAKDLGSRGWAIALGLLLGSAIGNLTDRFIRPPGGGQGHVVDFLDYNRWFIGNVADIWIVTGAILIVLLTLRGIGIDGKRDAGPVTAAAAAPEGQPGEGQVQDHIQGEVQGEVQHRSRDRLTSADPHGTASDDT